MKNHIIRQMLLAGVVSLLCFCQVAPLTVHAEEVPPVVEEQPPVDDEKPPIEDEKPPVEEEEPKKPQEPQKPEISITSISRVDYTTLRITWEKVKGADGYYLYRSTQAAGGFSKIATSTKGSTVTYTDKKLSCGKTYYYKVRAYDVVKGKKVYTEYSPVVSQYTRPHTVKVTTITHAHKKAVLHWSKTSGASGYEIYKKSSSDKAFQPAKVISSAKTLKWTDTKVKENLGYEYKVRAYKTVGSKKIYGAFSKVQKKKTVSSIVDTLKKYKGRKYRWGGKSLSGWDCSGFVQWVYKNEFGVNLEKSSYSQSRSGVAVNKNKRASWKKGDILIFASGGRVSHVGIYLGNNKMIHALNTKYGTIIQNVDYYERWDSGNYLVAVRRCL